MRSGLNGALGRIGIGLVISLVASGVAVASFLGEISPLIAASVGLGVLAAVLGGMVLSARRRRAVPSIDFVAARLLSLESRLAALDRPSDPRPPTDLGEITADITLLSELVKSLADAMSAQDQEIAELKAQLERLARDRGSSEPPDLLGPDRPPDRRSGSGALSERGSGTDRAPERLPNPRAPTSSLPETVPASRIVPSLLPTFDETVGARQRAEPDPVASEARRAAIVDALASERVELHLQPIVSLPQRRTRIYEVLARIRLSDDTLLAPAEFMPSLERLGRLPQLDRLVVARAVAIGAQLAARESDVRLSCNLSAASLRDGAALAAIERLVGTDPATASRFVFEIPQRSWRALPPEAAASFDRLRALGVSFALDHATDLRFEGITLGEGGIGFIKLPAEMLLGAVRAGDDPGPVGRLSGVLARHGVHVIVERVEREDEIPDLIDLDVALAQGFALGAPRPVRSDLAASRNLADDGAIEAVAAVASHEVPAASRPFRSFLRRTG